MNDNLKKELQELAHRILDSENLEDTASLLMQCREIYEKIVVLHHSEQKEKEVDREIVESISKLEVPVPLKGLEEKDNIQEPVKEDIPVEEMIQKENDEETIEGEAPLSLNDLFVPTFEGIKEDMSQKAEFKDTISLDETENLFVTKKEEFKQLSLNDKLVGSSIQVGLNDRIAFVNKLFNFSQSDFNKALSKLNDCTTKDEALKYFQYQVKPNYNWKGKEDLEERFIGLIERKFI